MSDRPFWRRLYDDVERAVAPPLEQVVHSPEFAQVSAWTMQATAVLRDQVSGTAAKVWHLVNLPAGTDVQRLRAQVGGAGP